VAGENDFTLYGCHLGAGWQYSYELHSYVEGMDGAEDDGSRAPTLTLPRIYASNQFVEPLQITSINKQNMTLTFRGQEEAGRYWIMIVLAANEPSVDVPGIKGLLNAVGPDVCRMEGMFMNAELQTVELQRCNLKSTEDYFLFAYIEDGNDAFDGTAVSMTLVAPPSNSFVVPAKLAATPQLTEMQVEFTPANGPASCRAWVLAVEEHLRPYINQVTVKKPLTPWIAGGKRCRIENQVCDDVSQRYTVDRCSSTRERGITCMFTWRMSGT
jgi:hypothetical protein